MMNQSISTTRASLQIRLHEAIEHSHIAITGDVSAPERNNSLGDIEHHLLHSVTHCEVSFADLLACSVNIGASSKSIATSSRPYTL